MNTIILNRGVASSSQLVRPNLTLSTIQSNVWVADIFDTAHIANILLAAYRCKSTKTKNHTSTVSITYFYTINYLVRIKINRMRGQPIIFHLLIWLFYLLYCNITS